MKYFTLKQSIIYLTLVLFSFYAGLVQADDWKLLKDESVLSFISVKKGDIAEVHKFDELSASIDAKSGLAEAKVHLTSVNTKIGIRDDRLKEFLFKTGEFATADLTAEIDIDTIKKLNPGQTMALELDGDLSLHGTIKPVNMKVIATKLADDTLTVSTSEPFIINASDFSLLDGIKKLSSLVGDIAISSAVPVSFVLKFKK